jgi:RES domain-containing protein
MIVWRLSPPAFAHALTGEGNRIVGARWNSPGRGVVYTCAHLSLCVLETYVHIPPEQRLSLPDFEAVRLGIPDDAGRTEVTVTQLEHLLSMPNAEMACRARGDRWLASGSDLVLLAHPWSCRKRRISCSTRRILACAMLRSCRAAGFALIRSCRRSDKGVAAISLNLLTLCHTRSFLKIYLAELELLSYLKIYLISRRNRHVWHETLSIAR